MIGIGPNLARRPTANVWSSGADLDFMFAEDASVVPRAGRAQLQCMRAGDTATVWNRFGQLEIVPANTPRINHDPSVLRYQNDCIWSEDFGNAAWIKDSGIAVDSNVAVAPDGTLTADKVSVNMSGFAQTYQNVTTVVSADGTARICVKAAGLGFVQLRIRNTDSIGNYFRAVLNLSTGAASGLSKLGNGIAGSVSAVALTDGWWEFKLTGMADTAGTRIGFCIILLKDAATVADATNSLPTDGILLWGAQYNSGATALPYRRTGATPYPKTYACKGLLVEEARTNVLAYPRNFDNGAWSKGGSKVSPKVAASPLGLLSADLITEDTSSTRHICTQAINVTSGTTYTLTVVAKEAPGNAAKRYLTLLLGANGFAANFRATFDLATGTFVATNSPASAGIASLGDGWFICYVAATANANAANGSAQIGVSNALPDPIGGYLGDNVSGFLVAHAQVEVGLNGTSAIVDGAAATTRNGEIPNAVVTPRREFTLLTDFYAPAADVSRVVVTLHDGTVSNRVSLRITAGVLALVVVVGGATQVSIGLGVVTPGTRYRIAARIRQDDFAASVNGAPAVIDNAGSVPVATNLGFGFDTTGAYFPLNSTLARVGRLPYGASNSDLQQLTA